VNSQQAFVMKFPLTADSVDSIGVALSGVTK